MNTYLLLGAKRSGNHLLINWILSHFKSYYFVNNCFPYKIKSEKKLFNLIEYLPSLNNNVNLLSFEFPQYFTENISKNKLLEIDQSIKFLFIARDPLNWISSYLHKHTDKNIISFEYVKELYLNNGDEYWNIWLECYNLWEKSEVPINYNKFVCCKEYRMSCANDIGIDFDEIVDNKVIQTLWNYKELGNIPSSFDSKMLIDKKILNGQLDVFNRYKKISNLFKLKPIPKDVIVAIENHWSDLKYDI